MRRIILLFLFIFICFLTAACSGDTEMRVSRVSEYTERAVEVKKPLQLKLDCENCKLEIYRWKKQEIKFEYTASVTGGYTALELEKKLKRFKSEAQAVKDGVLFRSRYSGGDKTEGKLELRVYIPKKTEQIELVCKQGTVKLFDDVKGKLDIRADILDVDINSFEGKLSCSINEGNIRLSSGKLTDGSMIETGKGNIRVKAEYQLSGKYCFIAREGLLDIFLPKGLKVVFTDDFPVEYAGGDPSHAEYASIGYSEDISDGNIASFRLESGIDRILVTRF